MAEPIHVQVLADYLVVKCDAPVFLEEYARKLAAVMVAQIQSQKKAIFDLRVCESAEGAALRIFAAPVDKGDIAPGRLAVIGDPEMAKGLAALNATLALPCFGALDQAVRHFAVCQKMEMFLNKASEAVTHVLSATMSLKPSAGAQVFRRLPFEIDMSAATKVSSRYFDGAITLGFSMKTYLKLMSTMFGTEFTEITPDIKDGAAELSNMIVGQLKTAVKNDEKFGLKVGTPSTMTGDRLRLFQQKYPPLISRPYATEHGELVLVFSAAPTAHPPAE